MIIESTATLRGLIDGSKGKFELGTGFLPRPNEDAYKKSGTIIGGASIWIINDRPAGRAGMRLGVRQVPERRRRSRPTGTPSRATTRSASPRYDEQLDKDWRRSTRSSRPPSTSCTWRPTTASPRAA